MTSRRSAIVCIADGYGIKVHVQRGQLVIEDGLGRNRGRQVFSRASHGLSRLVVLGHDGFVTFEAVRWLADLGIAYLHLDRDGRILASSANTAGDARLRRLQALSASSETGVEITRYLLRAKLAGQARVLGTLAARPEQLAALETNRETLEAADLLEELLYSYRLDTGDRGDASEATLSRLDQAGRDGHQLSSSSPSRPRSSIASTP